MIGTTYHRNILHRLGDALNAFKALPPPGSLYPPPQNNNSTGWINWEGWEKFETQQQGDRDKANAKKAVRSPWVFADVQAIANEFSTAELIIKERRGDKLEDVDNHPLEQMWESPNEHMGRSFVCAFWAWSYVLASRAYLYWVPSTNGGPPMEVWPVPPFMIKPIPSREDFIGGYVFRVSPQAEPVFIPSEYITYSHSVNLFDARDGLSFLAASMTEIEGDLAASVWNKNFFDDNNGLPDGFMGVSKDTLDPDLDRIRMELRDWFGGPKRGIAVGRSGDLAYTEFGRSQKDMEFINGREFASKVIGRTLGFPDGYWSDLANRANAEQARRTMISGAVWPLLVRLAEDMNAQKRGIVQRWFGEQYRAEFKDIRPEDNELKMRQLATYQPFLIVNELREMVGQEPLEDVRGLMLVAEITKGAPLPGTPAAQELEDIEAEKAEQAAQETAAQVAAGLIPDPNAPPELEDGGAIEGDVTEEEEAIDDEGAIVPMKAADLDRWERKALKSLRRFKRADVLFTSDAIPLPEQVAIHAALKSAQTAQEVKAAFSVDALLESVDSDARKWVEEAEAE
jgi:HK97 family phage portal protein